MSDEKLIFKNENNLFIFIYSWELQMANSKMCSQS